MRGRVNKSKRAARPSRRGVLLLVVLSLLVLFALIGVTYVVVAGQFRRASVSTIRSEQRADDFQRQLDDGFLQVVRGSRNPFSSIAPHSLLEDEYGSSYFDLNARQMVGDSVLGTLAAAPYVQGNGQFIDLPVVPEQNYLTTLSQVSGFYNGCVLTMLSGPARGHSTRVVGYQYVAPAAATDPPRAILRVMAFENITSSNFVAGSVPSVISSYSAGSTVPPVSPPSLYLSTVGHKFLINGRPFSGTGFGYKPAAAGQAQLTATDTVTGKPHALLPNAAFFKPDTTAPVAPALPYVDAAGPGGANEDYDAADFQNMALAQIVTTGTAPLASTNIIPSFHRPALLNYWQQAGGGQLDSAANLPLYRRISLRPIKSPTDHQYFTGSNPAVIAGTWSPITGPWDVDNDGDGVADSVWVDLGFPVLTAKDGRQYKRLYAFMCLDMDGRVNLNAHGLPGQADPATYDQPITGPFPGGNNTPVVPHGQGYGPAEIRLANVISANFAAGRTEFQNLMFGNQGLAIEGRYGEGATWATTGPVPGQTAGDQRLAQLKHFEFPNNYVTDGILTSYGTPCDLLARGIVALDFRGQPLFGRRAAVEWNNELVNSPYQLNLSGRGSKPAVGSSNAATPSTMTHGDNPFTVAELERVLRPLDIDSRSLPDRLLKLAPSLDGANSAVPVQFKANRFAVTSDSFDVPSPGAVATPDMRTVLSALNVPSKRGVNVVNMLAMKIIQARGLTLPLSATDSNNLAAELRKMLPPEVINGQRLNLNRALGNGRDDTPSSGSKNGVVDEMEEAGAGLETTANNDVLWQNAYGNSLAFSLTNGVDVNDDGKVDAIDARLARHLQARYLYVLAMLLRDPQDYPTSEGGGAGQQLAIRRLAQWAINVVDFRDADAAMTPFEYDYNPFDGWNTDGVLGSGDDGGADRRLVWGCESPEVVLTETLAFHDRRTADTKYESASGKLYDDNGNGMSEPAGTPPEDPNLDQTRVPQGSAFFELYCARNPSNPIASADLYTYNTTDQKWRLDLGRLAGVDANNTNGKQSTDNKVYPVWRMVITKSRIASANNDVRGRLTNKPDSTSLEPEQYRGAPNNGFSLLPQSTDPAVQIDRIVWFSTQAPNGHRDANLIYYNRTNNTQLLAGQYAVVGPRAMTYVGSINGNADFGAPSPQHIRLLPTIDITDNNGTSVYPTNLNTDHPPMPIVCAGAPPVSWINNTAQSARVAPGGNGIGIGLSISEPLFSAANYYPEPTQANANASNIVDAYGDLSRTASGGAGPFYRDQPLDSDPNAVPLRPLAAESILGTGTQANYKTVFLQRLSNPLEAWDEVNNPYLTVDWLPIDLTVFNGEDSAAGKTVTPWDPDDPAPAAARFATRQRGSPRTFNAGTSTFNLWTSLADAPPATNLNGPATNNFRRKLDGTLGYLNLPFQDTSMATPWLAAADLSALPAPQNTEYIGDPRRPFPWLTWNNRPYTSAMEVMLVPGSSSGRLLSEFNIAPVGTPINLYDPAASSSYRSQWGHLLNFFHTSSAAPSPTGGSANLARMLEYLEVPSRFVGTETMLSPANITLPATENGNGTAGRLPNRDTENALLSFFHPPFNGVSNFRDPGRVNVNTIPTPQVFHALQNVPLDSGDPTKAATPYDQWTTFQQFDESRRGYNGAFSSALPSEIGNPFRSAGSYDLVPLQTMVKATPINVTLLRANGVDPTNGNVPLFGVNHSNPAGQDDLYNTDRNPYFRYQQIQRLGNLTTTRSNVYAVWVTVGYFEVQPAPAGYDQDIYPDGYVLGQELGIDTGEVQRHRGFYIIDRTIPVGFQRGDDFNTDKAVLLKRFIE